MHTRIYSWYLPWLDQVDVWMLQRQWRKRFLRNHGYNFKYSYRTRFRKIYSQITFKKWFPFSWQKFLRLFHNQMEGSDDSPGLVDLRPHLSLWFGGTSPSKVRQKWWWGWSCPAYEEYPNKSDITSNKYISESVHFRVFQIRSSIICPVWMYNSSLVAMPTTESKLYLLSKTDGNFSLLQVV